LYKEKIMNTQDFEAQLKADNFGEIATVDKPIGYAMGEHQHPFEACALITKGDITLVVGGVSTTYGVGDVFRLPAQTPHHENAASNGVTYVVGRKYQAAA
jgi:quercetin dioxygenase-like cupin family protein